MDFSTASDQEGVLGCSVHRALVFPSDVKDEPAKPKETTFKGKAGWLKKSSGKFLGSYKDRYIQLDRTEIAVYENEDLKNCIERLDLENYDKCHELRSAFKKKYRLIVIRSANSASKVYDIKLQAQNQEEKEDWIKALSAGINRAKNKIFDEVKVDESISLDHVTRSRPKGNRARRPPTRIHIKEAADISSDGILRLDLDPFNNMPNGALSVDKADGETNMAPAKSLDDIPEEVAGEDTAPQKKVLKPPLPPSKENKLSESQDGESKPEEPAAQKKILITPMPPSKEQKPSESTIEEKESEEKTVVKPPIPPSKDNKPKVSASASEDTATENGESLDKSSPVPGETNAPETDHSPSLRSKDIKPKLALSLGDNEILSEDEGFNGKENEQDDAVSKTTEDKPGTLLNIVSKPQGVMWDLQSSATENSSVDQKATKSSPNVVTTITLEPEKPASELKLTPHSTPEAVKKSVPPPAPPKKKPFKPPVKMEDQAVQNDPVVSAVAKLPVVVSSSVEKGSETLPSDEPKEERKFVILSLSNSGTSESLDDKSGVEAEVKSIDSGQLSAEDSESSEQVTPSTDKLQSSLEVLDGVTSEEELETPDSKVQEEENLPSPVTVENTDPQTSSPAASRKTSLNKRSTSTGDLLEEMVGLRNKVTVEIEETGELLGKIAPRVSSEDTQDNEGITAPGILLATAMEKLKKADQFLKEAKRFKEQENKSNRTSW
ncbi:Pleckstrin homology domain-containing family O member 2 [Bagarius yarrelli]|uniref:Pleckstrin homology domain-containing family O member 2 n=1 Tax=Bagarius yarrelli TaxID=175774 RepID=A0A556U0M5_BAGYA|nr:Pleckstrin homology domain-containing family O member 2 [Bagarius yarrelli]